MSSLLRIVSVTCVTLAVVVAVGCGGSSDTQSANDYVKQINKAQTDFASSLTSTASGTTSSSDPLAGAKATFTKIDEGLVKVVAQLKAINPPDKVKNLHQDLINEISQLDTEVKKVADQVGSGDLKKIAAAQTDFATAATKLQEQFSKTITDINTKLQG